MNNKPLVSVIMIFLNAEEFIEEAIESVFAQTYENWELVLVDDGSTDASTRIAISFAEQYPDKVRYLEHEKHCNLGMSASRNLGFRHSRGQYLALLDADDVWLTRKIEKQVDILEGQPEAAMVYGSALWWYSWTGNPEDAERDHRDFVENCGIQPNSLIRPPALLTVFLRNGGAVPCLHTLLIRREVFDLVGGFEKSFRGMYEDQAFYAKACLKAPVYVEGECWAKYRRHENSCYYVAEITGQEDQARLFYLNWLERHLSEQEVKDPEVWQALYMALRPLRHPHFDRLQKGVEHFAKRVKSFLTLVARRGRLSSS